MAREFIEARAKRGRRVVILPLPALAALVAAAPGLAAPERGGLSGLGAAGAAAATRVAAEDTGAGGIGPTRVHQDARYGFSLRYPTVFVPNPDLTPPGGGSAEFWTADGRAGFTAYGADATGRTPDELRAEARRNIEAQSGGRVTYLRAGQGWFVISGHGAGRIVYQRTVIGRGGRVAATLYISYPAAEKARWDAAVTLMSRSFGFGPN